MLIGEVAALTGISAGRIRHYERIGLIRLQHRDSGYRTFSDADLLLLLRIDLLRSLGLGLDSIRAALDELGDVLEQHRAVLLAERDRLDRLLTAVDAAIDGGGVESLALNHRSSTGLVGRAARPMDAEAQATFARVFAGTRVPVPAIFGQMVIPEPVVRLTEDIAGAEGVDELIDRLAALVREILAGRAVAAHWVDQQLRDPLPEPVASIVRRGAALADSPVLRHGIPAWAAAISPEAGHFVDEVGRLGARRDAVVLGVIVVPRRPGHAPFR
ncbi:hypothetical protein BCD48_44625 [Pseudofrankia sp. BMG5.36]|nr:hypothetical protein BCD48_44625 [Pseudofrankia sp. BMG5.36]